MHLQTMAVKTCMFFQFHYAVNETGRYGSDKGKNRE